MAKASLETAEGPISSIALKAAKPSGETNRNPLEESPEVDLSTISRRKGTALADPSSPRCSIAWYRSDSSLAFSFPRYHCSSHQFFEANSVAQRTEILAVALVTRTSFLSFCAGVGETLIESTP